MGAQSSAEQQLSPENLTQRSYQNYTQVYNETGLVRNRVNQALTSINNEATQILQSLQSQGYLSYDNLCSQIGIQKADELSQFFPLQTLEAVRYQMGIAPSASERNKSFTLGSGESTTVESQRRAICADIVNFYQQKRQALEKILREAPKCQQLENQALADVESSLATTDLNGRLRAYTALDNFNQDILTEYNNIWSAVGRLKKASTERELRSAIEYSNKVLSNAKGTCMAYANQFARAKPILQPIPQYTPQPQPQPQPQSISVNLLGNTSGNVSPPPSTMQVNLPNAYRGY